MSYNSSVYNKDYYKSHCGDCYERGHGWEEIFARQAERIIKELSPKSVLDIGCAAGYLVEGLRDRGVEAYGIDISDYAIGLVRDDIKKYCKVKSATEKINEKYDLITCIEVLEHLSPEDISIAIDNMCSVTDMIIFSSTPFDFNEESHYSVNPTSFWAEKFAYNGFFHDVSYDCSYIAVQTMLFRRTNRTSIELVRVYEDKLFLLWQENCTLRDNVNLANARIGDLDRGNIEHAQEMERNVQQISKLQYDLDLANARIGDLDRGNIEHAQEMERNVQQISKLQYDLDLANARIGDLDRGNIEHAQEMEKNVQQISKLQYDLDLANARIGDLDRGNIEHAQEMERNVQQISKLQYDLDLANARIGDLDRGNIEHAQEMERNKQKFRYLLSKEFEKRENLENKILFFRDRTTFLESELYLEKSENDRVNTELESIKIEQIRYQDTVDSLGKELIKLKEDYERIKSTNEDIKIENQRVKDESQRIKDESQRIKDESQKRWNELIKYKRSKLINRAYSMSHKWKSFKARIGKYSNRALINRGIDYWSPVFNVQDYCDYNPDIFQEIGYDQEMLLKHFIYHGMDERRRASKSFDIDAYCKYNPDIEMEFGDNAKGLYMHYIENGIREGRRHLS